MKFQNIKSILNKKKIEGRVQSHFASNKHNYQTQRNVFNSLIVANKENKSQKKLMN